MQKNPNEEYIYFDGWNSWLRWEGHCGQFAQGELDIKMKAMNRIALSLY